MNTIIIVSDEGARSQAKELEQLIKLINCTDEIIQLGYDEYFPLREEDRMFAVCPSKPICDLLRVPAPAIKKTPAQIIPVTYLGSDKNNLPYDLQHIKGLVISGHYFPSFALDILYGILDAPNRLNTKYTHLILQNKSLEKSYTGTILNALSNLSAARWITNTTTLQYIKNLKDETQEAAEKLKNILASLPESEQRKITSVLKDTPLGECLEKIDLEKSQEAATTATIRLRH